MRWDPLMNYLSVQPRQLPSLERLECDTFPLLTMSFFHMHGHKIRLFRTTARSADGALAEALPLCSNLQSFVISQGSEPIDFPVYSTKDLYFPFSGSRRRCPSTRFRIRCDVAS
jgi:hypothetical protein